MQYYVLILLVLNLTLVNSLTCWKGTSTTYSESTEAKIGNICVRYNYCPTGWVNNTCSTTSTVYYDQLSILYAKDIPRSKDIIRCAEDYCNTLINPRTICYYGSSLTTFRREFDSSSKSCYSYMYHCKEVNEYCLQSNIGSTTLAYGISNSSTCADVKDLVKCCQTSYCTRTFPTYSTSSACTMYSMMKIITIVLMLYIISIAYDNV